MKTQKKKRPWPQLLLVDTFKKRSAFTMLCLGLIVEAQAQEDLLTNGNTVVNNEMMVSYSFGQVFYTSSGNNNSTVSSGVQQSYENLTTAIQNSESMFSLSVYPNPAISYVNLKAENYAELSYALFNEEGKQISSSPITSATTLIAMDNLSPAIYFLQITRAGEKVQEFKLLKR